MAKVTGFRLKSLTVVIRAPAGAKKPGVDVSLRLAPGRLF
jgi:hypothetical protein